MSELVFKRYKTMDTTIQLVLEELLKLRSLMERRFGIVDEKFESIDHKFENINEKFESVDQKFDGLIEKIDKGFEENAKDHQEIIKVINFIGNKVFDNHERRIAALETKTI